MAEGGNPDPNVLGPSHWEQLKKIRRLRELYKGRFTDHQCGVLLRHKNYDLEETLRFMFEEPRQIRHVIGQEDWIDVGELLRTNARANVVAAELRLFACQPCDHVWWRKVPSRKTVSRCRSCKQKWRAIKKNEEFGLARFHCTACARDFRDYGMLELRILQLGLIGKSQSYCHRCYQICEPIEILPPLKKEEREFIRRRRYRHIIHSCTAHNCFNPQRPIPGIPVITICVHPLSLPTKVPGLGSESHQSTGSTVNTFLSQDELQEPYEPSLADIDEIVSDSDDNA